MNLSKAFLGKGWKYPIQVNMMTGRIETESEEESIAQSIYLILMTYPGERVMRPDFGCPLSDFVFETMTYTSMIQIEKEVEKALVLWEPRIKDIEVHVDFDPEDSSRLLIEVNYHVRTTNNPYNMVFPYYLNEGILS